MIIRGWCSSLGHLLWDIFPLLCYNLLFICTFFHLIWLFICKPCAFLDHPKGYLAYLPAWHIAITCYVFLETNNLVSCSINFLLVTLNWWTSVISHGDGCVIASALVKTPVGGCPPRHRTAQVMCTQGLNFISARWNGGAFSLSTRFFTGRVSRGR